MDSIDKIKSALLESMDVFHEICETNRLDYFLLGGSLLGAVRHNGFIPWDDDIDVAMTRSDYNKLIGLADEFNFPFKLRDISLEDHYIYPYAKLENKSLIIEEDFYKPFQSGVWIDIFPLDYTFEKPILQKIHFSTVKFIRRLLILKTGSFKLSENSVFSHIYLKFISFIFKLIPRCMLSVLFVFFEQVVGRLLKDKVNYANLHGAWGTKEIAPVIFFSYKQLYSFEGRSFWGPKKADIWLKKVYGDYMTLPEESKRVASHIGRIVPS